VLGLLCLQEVYFSGGNSERLSSLRHKKRYQVPQSPLLQVRLGLQSFMQHGLTWPLTS